MTTDAQRATDLADALLGDVATDEIRALIKEAFRLVREDEHGRLLAQLRESIRLDGMDVS